MGFFKSLIEGYKLIKEVKATRKEWQRNEKRYLPMTAEEMAALSDEELLLAATTRTNHQAACNGEENGFQQLNEQQKVLYSIDTFEINVTAQDGGLCDFFVYPDGVAPYISDCLGTIGAEAHKKLFDDFVTKNRIDLTDLSAFESTRHDDAARERLMMKCPFTEFDRAYAALPPLSTHLTAYIKEHIDSF